MYDRVLYMLPVTDQWYHRQWSFGDHPVNRQTHTQTENITFMQLRWRAVINHRIFIDLKIYHPKLTKSVGYSLCGLRKQSTLLSHSFGVPVVHIRVFHKHTKLIIWALEAFLRENQNLKDLQVMPS